MSLSEQLTKLKQARSDIKQALEVKLRSGGGTSVPDSLRFTEIAAYIEKLEIGKAITIVVTAPDFEGETLTATKGSKKFTGIVTGGTAKIVVDEGGIWTISAVDGTETELEIEVKLEWETKLTGHKIYGIEIDHDEADPDKRVVYTDDAVGMTPAKMNLSTGQFDYGSWENVWFIRDNHVHALQPSGESVGQCKDDDYSQFLDGSNSTYRNSSTTYNFMASIPLCWIHRSMKGNKRVIKVSDIKIDDTYHAYGYEDENGNVQDYFYVGAFEPSLISNKLRSVGGQTVCTSQTLSAYSSYAQANGKGWEVFDFCKMSVLQDLLTLISKSTDETSKFGSYTSWGKFKTTGNNTTTGRFFGKNDINSIRRMFHIENLFINKIHLMWGMVVNMNYSNYLCVQTHAPYSINTSSQKKVLEFSLGKYPDGDYISKMTQTEYGALPIEFKGSSVTYECAEHGEWGLTNNGNKHIETYSCFGFNRYGCEMTSNDYTNGNYSTILTYTPQGATSNPSA